MTLLSELKQIDNMHDAGTITQAQQDKMSADVVKKYQPTSDKKTKKIMGIAIIALLIALLDFSIGGSIIQINESQVNNLTNDLNLKVNKSGDTMTGTLNFTVVNNSISFLSDAGGGQVLINETGGSTSSASETGYVIWARFNSSSSYTSNMLSMNIASYTAGANMRMAIYNGNGSNRPYALLSESASQAVTNTGWNNITYPTIVINGSNTEYWIAIQTQNIVTDYYSSCSSCAAYKSQAYGSFPSFAGSSTYTYETMNMRIYSETGILRKTYCLRATFSGSLYTVAC